METVTGAAAALYSMGPAGAAIGGASAAGGIGAALFNYNRGNFRMDQKLHYARFTAGHNMAIAQQKQYREDLVDLSTLTCTRMDVFHAVSAMSLTILTALYCPGRLGLHTVAPPSWLMGLFMANLGGCYLFLILTMWLAMHASMRADTAVTHMLTRFVRLPIPSTYMLDRARKFMANYEEVGSEMFRFPMMQKHQKEGHGKECYNEAEELDEDATRRTRHDCDLPIWYRKEKRVDTQGHQFESMIGVDGTCPQHFEVYREIQNEWWPYDVYARVGIFLAHMHLTHAWSYHQIGHGFQEQRALFAVGTVVFPLFATQQIVLTLDLVPESLPIHRLGPFGPVIAYAAAVIEYQRWYSAESMNICFALVYIAYGIHIIYTLHLLTLCSPSSKSREMKEEAGAAWWPGSWNLPAAFHHAVWLVAPPNKLDPDQNDIVHEMRELGKTDGDGFGTQPKVSENLLRHKNKDNGLGDTPSTVGGGIEKKKRWDVHRELGEHGESPAWKNVQVGLVAMLIAWVWLTIGFTYEVANQGTTHPSLLSAPGLPNFARDPRWRNPKPGREHAVEVGWGGLEHGPLAGERHGEAHGGHGGGEHGSGSGSEHGTEHGSEHSDEGGSEHGTEHGTEHNSGAEHGDTEHGATEHGASDHESAEHSTDHGTEHGAEGGPEHGSEQGSEHGTEHDAATGTGAEHGAEHGDEHGSDESEHSEGGAEHDAEHGSEGGTEHGSDSSDGGAEHGAEHSSEDSAEHDTEHGAEHGSEAEHGAEHGSEAEHGAEHGSDDAQHGGEHSEPETEPATGPGPTPHPHRRLERGEEVELAQKLKILLPHLKEIASGRASSVLGAAISSDSKASGLALSPVGMQLPALFEPRLLACGPAAEARGSHRMLLLSPHGRGSLIGVDAMSPVGEQNASSSAFVLEGVTGHGPLIAASWDRQGLLLASASGIVLECAGHGPVQSRWRCEVLVDAKLPLGASTHHFAGSIAISRTTGAQGGLRAAVVYPGEEVVSLFSRVGGIQGAPWMPRGEARVAALSGGLEAIDAAAFEEGSSLLLASRDGSLARLNAEDGRSVLLGSAAAGGHASQAICSHATGHVARLSLRASAVGSVEPTLVFGKSVEH